MSNGPCQLLSLPPELRLMIYESLWQPLSTSNANVELLTPTSVPTSTDLSLLRTCRQIHHEARRIAFLQHTFILTRNLHRRPLAHEPRVEPISLVRSLAIPECHLTQTIPGCELFPPRCYSFKEICSLVRRFRHLEEILVLTDAPGVVTRTLWSRTAHVNFRLRKARYFKDERLAPSYDLRSLRGDKTGRVGWRLTVNVGDSVVRGANILLVGLKDTGVGKG
ncbi:uncharacterized protein BDR25DRAFT_112418 [Lindgomyces ingoldianus]|uniref:Uncharacterized protein n=1 Tax=Lindgomyces ingoldianus TaxID=673940 RepID=A0ACB6R8J0_9PLEO|nr:uncharacterized protein BDR25DRAFT_112418 [Lindgomyces ingoldianus]KAF2474837.1 hypothetical protein BDR25DRAFT_112418 [Lindgomyces ingoldianus]